MSLPTTPFAEISPVDWIEVRELEKQMEMYLSDCELRLLSSHTIEVRRYFFRNLMRYLNREESQICGGTEIRAFLHELGHGPSESSARQDSPKRPARPVTVHDYYTALRLLFDWMVEQNVLALSPFRFIKSPRVQHEIKPPLFPEQLKALFEAAGHSTESLRNLALLAFLLDTGCRASEVVALRVGDIDLAHRHCRVEGKGKKYRTVFFGQHTAERLRGYLAFAYSDGDDSSTSSLTTQRALAQWPLFYSGCRLLISDESNAHETQTTALVRYRDPRGLLHPTPLPLTRYGLLHLIKRLGKRAGIQEAVSLHAFRRTFAVSMLRSGAHVFSVQALLGHSDLGQTRKYCQIAMTDAEAQHRRYSPMDCSAHFLSTQ